MNRLDMVLVLLVVGCALALVQSQHRAREQFAALEHLKTEARELDETHSGLAIELSTWGDPARVDEVARERLGLIAPSAERMATLDARPRSRIPHEAPTTETAGLARGEPKQVAKLEATR